MFKEIRMTEYYHIDWRFSDNTIVDIDLLNIIMSYGDSNIQQKYSYVLKQLEYLFKEFQYLRNPPKNNRTRSRLCSHKTFSKFILSRTRFKKKLMRHVKPSTPPSSPVSFDKDR